MGIVKLELPIGVLPVNGKQITFSAPCDCSITECIQIDGVDYTVVDAMGNTVTGTARGGIWCSGATVSVVLDVDNKKAFLLNGGTLLPMTETKIREICS
jgi:hypothetical protein